MLPGFLSETIESAFFCAHCGLPGSGLNCCTKAMCENKILRSNRSMSIHLVRARVLELILEASVAQS